MTFTYWMATMIWRHVGERKSGPGMTKWLAPLTLLQIADLALTSRAGIGREANVLMYLVWTRAGFLPLVLFKVALITTCYLAILMCTHTRSPFHVSAGGAGRLQRWALRAMLVYVGLVSLCVVAWNIYWL